MTAWQVGGYLLGVYVLGSIPFSVLVAKYKKVDLRQVGSGNIGATNVYRALGMKYAAFVFLLDALKGYIPVVLSLDLGDSVLLPLIVAGVCVAGHSLSMFAKFRGGKGAATGLGVLAALSPDVVVVLVMVASILIWRFRVVSLTTLICSVLAPLLLYFFDYSLEYVAVFSCIALLIVVRHWSNIQRLIRGEENKV